MTIEKLEDKHYSFGATKIAAKYHTNLSIEFAISVLENIHFNTGYVYFIDDKIKELKQHLK